MTFQTRKIRKKPPFRPFSAIKEKMAGCGYLLAGKWKSYALVIILIVVGAGIVVKVTSGAYKAVKDFDAKDAVFALGSELKKDENGYTNLVILGDGGHVRDGADLVDTIIVASIDFDKKAVSMLSIPRDFYIKTEKYGKGKINEFYRDNKNSLGQEKAYTIYKELAKMITGFDIQYFIRSDFNAFVEVVDSLGGITVDVKDFIYDPYYPNVTDDGYTVFRIDAGLQEMSGETALKFVRSRKTTSDFDRAARQQQVLVAMRDKALSMDVLTSPSTIKKIYQAIKDNINTDLTIRELIALAGFGRDFERKNLVSKVINDDPTRDGGFLYTPERKYFNGQFVLIPDSMEDINRYSDLIFHDRDVILSDVKLEVLNGSDTPGIAREVASTLIRYGFKVINIDNFTDDEGEHKKVDRSFFQYNKWQVDEEGNVIADHQKTLDVMEKFLNGDPIPSDEPDPLAEADISVVLGEDYEIY